MSPQTEDHAWLVRIETKLDALTADVARITAFGCAQAPRHDKHDDRIRALETSMDQAKGGLKLAHVLAGVIGGVLTFVAGKLWK